MKSLIFFLSHQILFLSILLIMMSFQGALWLQLFSQFPAPCLWLTFIVYGAFHRTIPEAIFLTYATSLIATPFLNAPFGITLVCNSFLMLFLLAIKSRFMITNSIFLAILTLFATLSFPIIHFFLSFILEPNPIQNFEFISWIISALLTALMSVSLFQFYTWFDSIMAKNWPSEIGRY